MRSELREPRAVRGAVFSMEKYDVHWPYHAVHDHM